MLKNYRLQTRQREIRYQGYFKNFAECLETALQNNVDCTYLNLREANLSHANLDGADFTGCDFSGGNLSGTNMSETNLTNALFPNAALSDVCLCDSVIEDALFFETSFSGTDIAGASINDCLFSCPSFFGVNLHDAKLIKNCRYYVDSTYCPINKGPIIVNGLEKRIIIMDEHIILGHVVFSFQEWEKTNENTGLKSLIRELKDTKIKRKNRVLSYNKREVSELLQ